MGQIKSTDDLIEYFQPAFTWLLEYDDGTLQQPIADKEGELPSYEQACQALAKFKQVLCKRKEATELFARERDNALEALLGNLRQTLFGEPAYPSIQSKAAHLLYFVVKNHPFTDGNKRSGAFLFIDFLYRNGALFDELGQPCINQSGLTALTLLIAQSAPEQKEHLINLTMNMITI